jgi:hypothetical protein
MPGPIKKPKISSTNSSLMMYLIFGLNNKFPVS